MTGFGQISAPEIGKTHGRLRATDRGRFVQRFLRRSISLARMMRRQLSLHQTAPGVAVCRIFRYSFEKRLAAFS